MRAFLVAILALVVAVSGCRSTPPAQGAGGGGGGPTATSSSIGGSFATEFTLGTWNLETFPKTSETIPQVASRILNEPIHLLAVQEIDNTAAFDTLLQSLDGYAGVLNDDNSAFLRVGLIYDTSRIQISEVETIFFANKHAFPRPPLKARVEAKLRDGTVFDFVVVVVHLKAKLDPASRERRELAIKVIDQWLQGELQSGEQDYIVLGDYNDELGDQPDVNVFTPLLDASDSYTFLTEPLENSGDYTFIPFKSFLDHVLVTNSVLDVLGTGAAKVQAYDKQNANYEAQISDHRPVSVMFVPR